MQFKAYRRAVLILEVSEDRIIKLCKKNKREGFELLFKRYEKYIYSICFRYTYLKDDALDLMQEVFIKIYKAFESFNESMHLSPWIKRITVNTCMNFKRDNKKNSSDVSMESDIGNEGQGEFKDTVSDGRGADDEVIYLDTKKQLEKSISELPESIRMAVILRHIKGLTYKEISQLMDCPEGTVKTYIFRGRKLLKDNLVKKGIWEV